MSAIINQARIIWLKLKQGMNVNPANDLPQPLHSGALSSTYPAITVKNTLLPFAYLHYTLAA